MGTHHSNRVRRGRGRGARAAWANRNPPASTSDIARARRVAAAVAEGQAMAGAAAVVLSGSWARGDARRESDLDVWVIHRRSGHRVFLKAGFVVSIKRSTVREERKTLRTPQHVGQVIPAWREARILFDPDGIAAGLKRDAARFRWKDIASACDRYVAQSIVEWGEEAVKLTRLMATGTWETAAVQRNLLANHMAGLMAIDRRVCYDENHLWESLGERMGARWHRAQRVALSRIQSSLEESCQAALDLYCLSASAVGRRMTAGQRAVVDKVCDLARGPA